MVAEAKLSLWRQNGAAEALFSGDFFCVVKYFLFHNRPHNSKF
jgi:hypothetical protein